MKGTNNIPPPTPNKPAAKPLKIPITIKISIRLTSILFSKSDEMSFN
jgi:hypothetical protein